MLRFFDFIAARASSNKRGRLLSLAAATLYLRRDDGDDDENQENEEDDQAYRVHALLLAVMFSLILPYVGGRGHLLRSVCRLDSVSYSD